MIFVFSFVSSVLFTTTFTVKSYAAENFQNNSLLQKRNYISVVGSSTVYPFTSSIAERFGRHKKFRTPTIEATGTGGGFKLFCSGIGSEFPDFVNASRKIEESEIEKCHENGVKKVDEIKIGYDGIILANSITAKKINLTKMQIFLALAEKIPANGKLINNPFKKWQQIDPNLPNSNIRIYGPPATSGTRDAFVELIMENVCVNLKIFTETFSDKKILRKKCGIIRSDGAFIEAGENDNLILQKLRADKEAFGIFGFSFLEENKNTIQAAKIDDVDPSLATIINNKYSISRPLFIYFKADNFDSTPGMKEFIKEILSKDVIGTDGYLVRKGLVPLSNSELKKLREKTLKSL